MLRLPTSVLAPSAALGLVLVLLSAPAPRAAAAPGGAPSIYRDDDLALAVRTQELKAPRIEEALRLLDLRPGMSVLDIGAGTGQQSYRLAAAVGPEGRVVATDIAAPLVDYVAAQAKRRGLPQLEARLVSPEGVDPFYASRSFDLILMWEVFNYLGDPVAFYRGLLPSLKPGGRIALVESEMAWDRGFYPEDVKDWRGLAEAVAGEPAGSAYAEAFAGLRKELSGGLTPQDPLYGRRVAYHLNAALDGRLYRALSDGLDFRSGVDFTDRERPYALWLLHRLALDRVERRQLPRLEYQLFKLLQSLNKMLLIQRYRAHLGAATPDAPYWSAAPEVRWALAGDRRSAMMRAAGYAPLSKTPLPPFQAVWVFTPASR